MYEIIAAYTFVFLMCINLGIFLWRLIHFSKLYVNDQEDEYEDSAPLKWLTINWHNTFPEHVFVHMLIFMIAIMVCSFVWFISIPSLIYYGVIQHIRTLKRLRKKCTKD